MKVFKKAASVILLLILTMAFYQNCANYSEDGLFDETSITDPTAGTIFVSAPNHSLEVEPEDDYLSAGGTCFTGKVPHRIEAKIFSSVNDRIKVDVTSAGCQNGSATPPNSCYILDRHLRSNVDIKCENGRYYFVMPVTCDSMRFRDVGYRAEITLITKDDAGVETRGTPQKKIVLMQWLPENISYCQGLGF